MADSTITPRFLLYYSPPSYFSQKALLALFEKGESFTEKIVNNRTGESSERWYMLINPKGQVPVLQDGDKIIPESEDIIDYIDREIPREPCLVPPLNTDLGTEVAKFRKLFYEDVPMRLLTLGLRYSPDRRPPGDAQGPMKANKAMDQFYASRLSQYLRLAEEQGDMREDYLKKAEEIKAIAGTTKDSSTVQGAVDALCAVLDKTEERLNKTKEGTAGETWLFGSTYTAADISLTAILNRLTHLGLQHFMSSSKRRALGDYWKRVQARPAFKKVQEMELNFMKKT